MLVDSPWTCFGSLCSFFFNDPATTEIYTLSLHDALPIFKRADGTARTAGEPAKARTTDASRRDRKSTRLNSSHPSISYAVFCLKKKKKVPTPHPHPLPQHDARRAACPHHMHLYASPSERR